MSSVIIVPFFVIWSIINSIAWYYQSTQALPYTTIILLMLIWLIGEFYYITDKELITDLKISRTVANLLQRAKKVMSDSPGLVDFAIRLVIFVLNLPDRQVQFFGEIQITEGW